MSKSICFQTSDGIVAKATLNVEDSNRSKSITISKTGNWFNVEYEESKDSGGWKDSLNSAIMRNYEYFAKSALDDLAKIGFKKGGSGIEPIDYYEHYDHEIEWNKYIIKNGKVVAKKYRWKSSIIPKSWSAYVVATKSMRRSELESFLSTQFELDKEEISLLIGFIGKDKNYVKRNIVQVVDDKKVIIDDLTLAKKNNRFVMLMVKKFHLDLSDPKKSANVKRRITKIIRMLTGYGIKNIAVIPDPGSIALGEIIKLPVIINGSEYNVSFAIESSADVLLMATDTISKKDLTKFLKREYSLNGSLIRKIIAFFENKAKIPFTGYIINIL